MLKDVILTVAAIAVAILLCVLGITKLSKNFSIGLLVVLLVAVVVLFAVTSVKHLIKIRRLERYVKELEHRNGELGGGLK